GIRYMRLLLLGILIAAVLIFVLRFASDAMKKKNCTGASTGRFMYSDCIESPNPQRMRSLWVPIYEFAVGDMMYLVRSSKTGPGEKSFPAEAKVIYDVNDPELCFVNGSKGKVISKYSDPKLVKKEEDPWNEYYDVR
ncbi:MAG: hypothetical protein J6W48_09540, partial [Lachnospiraceae bacterium]|nr:hypothetical protein [Lachnospiraceae bacterium]